MQLDFPTSEKFGLQYINEKQELKTPVIIHQSPIGSYQRFIALLLEQTEGKLPF
jgi:threonyl-tRNA synthetase